ncbi:MAG: CHASE domain-containing protein [Nitrospinae bacterium]|nr:CHASE domain-containing protein [Nitrospinota bacterium]
MKIRLSYIAIIASILVTFVALNFINNINKVNLKNEFFNRARDISEELKHNVKVHVEQLYAGKALFGSSDYVSRGEWESFYYSMQLQKRYPGIKSFAFVRFVNNAEKNEFINRVRTEKSTIATGYPDFTIFPEGERENYFVIDYVDPWVGNEYKHGFDIKTNKEYIEAINESWKSGKPQYIKNIWSKHDANSLNHFCILLPIYNKGVDEKAQKSINDLYGFIDGEFVVSTLFREVNLLRVNKMIDFQVFNEDFHTIDNESIDRLKQSLIYTTFPNKEIKISKRKKLQHILKIDVAGKQWTIYVTPKKELLEKHENQYVQIVFLLGMVISLLLFGMLKYYESHIESEERFRLLGESTFEGILIHDKGKILDVNNSLVRMFGYDYSEYIGRSSLDMVVDEDKEQTMENIKRGFRDDQETHEVRCIKKDGTVIPVVLRGRDILYKGKTARVVAVYDLSEHKKLEEDLKKTNKELNLAINELKENQQQLIMAEKMASLGQLVAGISHEINTPIGIGVTASSYLRENTKKISKNLNENKLKKSDLDKYFKDANEGTELIHNNLQRAAELIRSFKMVSVDQTSEEIRDFELKDYIEETLRSLKPQLKRTHITVDFNAEGLFYIHSVPGVFAQIITNFVMNSILHAFEKNEEGKITIHLTKDEKNLKLDFHDNGKGISKENIKKIFEPFYTTRRNQGGTGLGLHIVFNIVFQTLGGTIRCESEVGKGTTFHISAPLKKLLKEHS